MINGELNHYGEIGKIIGKDNLFFLDELHPIYIGEGKSLYGNHKKNIKLVESYPSNFGFDKPNYIQLKEVLKNKVKFDFAIFSYKVDEKYMPSHEAGIIWNDSTLAINWLLPETQISVSEKDSYLQKFDNFKTPFK